LTEGIEIGIEKGKTAGLTEGIEIGIEKGKAAGLTEGIEKGEKLKTLEIAKNAKALGFTTDQIQKITNLTKGQIEELL